MANSLKVVVDLDLLEAMVELINTSLSSQVSSWEDLPYEALTSVQSDISDISEKQFYKLIELINTLQR